MGSGTSQYISTFTESWSNPNVIPNVTDRPKHDPLEGFDSGREERGFSFIVFTLQLDNYSSQSVKLLMKICTGLRFLQIDVTTVPTI